MFNYYEFIIKADYILGHNPFNRSLVVGSIPGHDPLNVHHRGSHVNILKFIKNIKIDKKIENINFII